jgi:hypothetical protein
MKLLLIIFAFISPFGFAQIIVQGKWKTVDDASGNEGWLRIFNKMEDVR